MNKNIFTVVVKGQQTADLLNKNGYNSIIISKEDLRNVFKNVGTQFLIYLNSDTDFCLPDVDNIAQSLVDNPEKIAVCTVNNTLNAPLKLYEFLSGIKNNLIKSNLLGFSRKNAILISNCKCKDTVFEKSILLEARTQGIEFFPVQSTCTRTIEYDFNILKETFMLYSVFIKFSFSALFSYIIDIGTYYLFLNLLALLTSEYKILLSTVFSRILCSLSTYVLNKRAVFKTHSPHGKSLVKFFVLAIGQLIASWLLVWGISSLFNLNDIANTGVKVIVDFAIFMLSFTLQRDWVFKDV